MPGGGGEGPDDLLLSDELGSRFELTTLRAAWWAQFALRRARRALRRHGIAATIGQPPPLPWRARRGVEAVLRRQSNTCLERALVLQRWLAAHGRPLDIIVGVTSPTSDFRAHAWLDVPAAAGRDHPYQELLRLPPP